MRAVVESADIQNGEKLIGRQEDGFVVCAAFAHFAIFRDDQNRPIRSFVPEVGKIVFDSAIGAMVSRAAGVDDLNGAMVGIGRIGTVPIQCNFRIGKQIVEGLQVVGKTVAKVSVA